eukprot:TRINITY_DN18681_c0_g1::TRINITY_DN18681_c0_g1_i1::g.20452::m.20452 TRINITY_DN18681_c0_g1::TRINITY_DN18681_c0_g1_i1::g.20452  ORF type:complete len:206 (+),score=18.13,sp/Q3UF64/RNFT2_MOUSE/33.61/1e-12,zf-RING_2/PF13639.1/1.9e-11,zf-C3HC4_2/PF13923.1/7.2e+03,zf-C3HC4_2/PF13923.1/3e-09,zf-C3HC4_3/PF13920.1/1e-08,zf-C3HC4/PF00097.20/5.7e-08,zf-RING_6/PF14835.1/2.3e-07,zf-C3HC4_4/PF15227.1/1e-06,zf-RING_5/PF14634.1/9.2e-07,zf-RING_UBOX/PF13445.1/3e-06,zf-RING_UBOX/PF13445.1/1.5e+02,zf-rbx1/PF12678.2/
MIFFRHEYWRYPLFLPSPGQLTLTDTYFAAALAYCTIRAAQISLKALSIWSAWPSRRGRHRSLRTFAGLVYCMYQCAVPVPLWTRYLLSLHFSTPFTNVLAACYLMSKGLQISKLMGPWSDALLDLVYNRSAFGRYATGDEVAESGSSSCPICTDTVKAPIALAGCEHIFCEECIDRWLSEHCTCPICRKKVPRAVASVFPMIIP